MLREKERLDKEFLEKYKAEHKKKDKTCVQEIDESSPAGPRTVLKIEM